MVPSLLGSPRSQNNYGTDDDGDLELDYSMTDRENPEITTSILQNLISSNSFMDP